MKIIIETPGFRSSPSMRAFATTKVGTLAQLNDKIVKAQVTILHESTVRTEKIICEINLFDSGKNLFAKASSSLFEDAILKTVNILKRKLRKNKTRKLIPRKKAKQTKRKL
ncbi:MAG TPA: HPF/RaiA family ribosome-associated protein [Bacteroidia bacterium]|nr:HPF/RaiA family ribosome-associated protein [Bacteroidia bacterium]HNS12356.1 HPF/RaiA family ribosome-associated protein [Bacteroidia bacterium]